MCVVVLERGSCASTHINQTHTLRNTHQKTHAERERHAPNTQLERDTHVSLHGDRDSVSDRVIDRVIDRVRRSVSGRVQHSE